jgi:hypothetical protein
MAMREAGVGFWWGSLKERENWRDRGVDGKIILEWKFRKWDLVVWTGLGWLRIERGDGRL